MTEQKILLLALPSGQIQVVDTITQQLDVTETLGEKRTDIGDE